MWSHPGNEKLYYCKTNLDIQSSLNVVEDSWAIFQKINHLRNAWTFIKNICFFMIVCVFFWNLVPFIKNTAIKQHMSMLEEGRNICYKKQKILRKVCMFFRDVYYACNICISRNFWIAASRFWGYLSILKNTFNDSVFKIIPQELVKNALKVMKHSSSLCKDLNTILLSTASVYPSILLLWICWISFQKETISSACFKRP